MSNEDKDTSSDLDEATDDSDLQTMSVDDADGSSDMDPSSGFDEATADPDLPIMSSDDTDGSSDDFSDNGAESIQNDSKVPPTTFNVLPIDIVYRILESVPSKIVVETFILSKKWSFLWKDCPHLNFKVEDFFKDGTPPFDSYEDMLTFANYFILLRHYSSVHTFRLLFDYFVEPKRFFALSGSWIHYALNRGVEILSVPVKMEYSRGVIDVIFQNNNLVELCVHFHESIFEMLPLALPSVELPSLKRLQLVGLYLNSVLISQIITGCPLLNNLSLEDSIIGTNEISSDIIQRLYLHSSFYVAPSTVFSILNAPRTTDLTLYERRHSN